MTTTASATRRKFKVDIEGTIHEWPSRTISVPEIRELGGLPEDLPVLLINLKTNEQETVPEGECVRLRPGMAFARKYQFRRG